MQLASYSLDKVLEDLTDYRLISLVLLRYEYQTLLINSDVAGHTYLCSAYLVLYE